MTRAALLYLCLLHDVCTLVPTPDDWHRFNLPREPAYVEGNPSRMRTVWLWTVSEVKYVYFHASVGNVPWSDYDDACWRTACWYQLDDMADVTASDCRREEAAKKLHRLLGPWKYYMGTVPTPWKE